MGLIEKITHPIDVFENHWQAILSRYGQPKEFSIDFLPELDNKIWGLKRKKLIIIGGRPSQGKSSFLLQTAYSFAKQGKTIFFFSFEMTKEVCLERMVSTECEIDNWLITTGKVKLEAGSYEFKQGLFRFKENLKDKKFFIIESIGKSLPKLDKILSMFDMKPDAVFIDYGNMVESRERQTRKEAIDEYLDGFRALAVRSNFCAILGAQINRKTHDGAKAREPQLWELKESGKLEEISDMVFLLHWPYFYDRDKPERNEYYINIAKNRDGRTGRQKVLFFPEYSKFKPEVGNGNSVK